MFNKKEKKVVEDIFIRMLSRWSKLRIDVNVYEETLSKGNVVAKIQYGVKNT